MPEKILIVSDQPDMVMLLEILITDKTDYAVIGTSNPLEVEELLRQHDVNLVLTELIMPSLSGLEVMAMAKRRDPDLPVIVITPSCPLEAAEEAVHQGAYDFVTKPFRKEQMLVALERALEWQRVIRENRNLKSRMKGLEPEAKSS